VKARRPTWFCTTPQRSSNVGPGFDLAEVVEADFGDLLPDARADIRIGEALQHRRNASFLQPGRQQEAQRVSGPIIGIGEQAYIAGIVADEARERAAKTRVWLALAG